MVRCPLWAIEIVLRIDLFTRRNQIGKPLLHLRSPLDWPGHLVDVQSKHGHAEAAEKNEQILSGESHWSRCKTLCTNVTAAT